MRAILSLAVLAAVGDAAAVITIAPRPTTVYSTVTSKLRIQGTGFGSGDGDKIHLGFIPKIAAEDYKVTIVSDTVLSLGLLPGKSWPSSGSANDGEGTTMYLTSFVKDGQPGNQLEEPVAVATARAGARRAAFPSPPGSPKGPRRAAAPRDAPPLPT